MSLSSPSPGWTDARVETLTTLWRSGLSASQIAKALGAVTRNAVIGKAHRLGLPGRAQPRTPRLARTPRQPSRSRTPARARLGPAALAGAPSLVRAPDERGQISELGALTAHACRWPIGDPRAADFSFCGRPADAAMPYCEAHSRRAHRPRAETLERDSFLRRLLSGAVR